MPDIVDLLRGVNLVLALVVFFWLTGRRLRHPDWFPRGGLRRDIWAMAFCWDLALITASAENLIHADTFIRVGVSMAAIITTLAILLRPAKDWPGVND